MRIMRATPVGVRNRVARRDRRPERMGHQRHALETEVAANRLQIGHVALHRVERGVIGQKLGSPAAALVVKQQPVALGQRLEVQAACSPCPCPARRVSSRGGPVRYPPGERTAQHHRPECDPRLGLRETSRGVSNDKPRRAWPSTAAVGTRASHWDHRTSLGNHPTRGLTSRRRAPRCAAASRRRAGVRGPRRGCPRGGPRWWSRESRRSPPGARPRTSGIAARSSEPRGRPPTPAAVVRRFPESTFWRRPPNGRLTSTAMPRSAASGSTRSAAARLPIE